MQERRRHLSTACVSQRKERSDQKRYEAEDQRMSQSLKKESFLVDHKRRLLYCWNHKVNNNNNNNKNLLHWTISSIHFLIYRLHPAFGCGSSQSWEQGRAQKLWTTSQAKYRRCSKMCWFLHYHLPTSEAILVHSHTRKSRFTR